jgi:nucleotide-binding universal stress UspA family protein
MAGGGRVVVGVSGSPGSIRALRYAANVAHGGDLPLVAVLAWVPPGGDLADRRAPSPYLREIWKRAAGDRLRNAIAAAWGGVPLDLGIHQVVARGPAGAVLVNMADSADDLLVLGTGGQGPLMRAWRGKVTRYCLAHADCPVLAIPPSPLAKQARGPRWRSFSRRRLTADLALTERA